MIIPTTFSPVFDPNNLPPWFNVLFGDESPEILLQASLLDLGPKTLDGNAVIAVAIPWRRLFDAIQSDPSILAHFARESRAFEEFLAGAFKEAGFDEVILTPRSNDHGRDLVAIKSGFCSVKILGQAKAYSPGHLVTHDDCRAMLGVLGGDRNANKGVIITTSDFAPGIVRDPYIAPHLPDRLTLINGQQLPDWLAQVPLGFRGDDRE